jgi:hypothetical protein
MEISYVEYFPAKPGQRVETTYYVCGCLRDDFADRYQTVKYYPCQEHYGKV